MKPKHNTELMPLGTGMILKKKKKPHSNKLDQ